MKEKIKFIDTNILVYAYDISAGRKHEIASQILIGAWDNYSAVLSTQIIQEFYITVTKKIPTPLKPNEAKEIIEHLAEWKVVSIDLDLIFDAIAIHQKHKLSFWDGLVISAAKAADADIVLSEDMSHSQRIGELTVINPFV